MFAAMGKYDEASLEVVRRASEPWTARMIEAGRYMGWITWDEESAIASAGMLLLDWPPHPFDPAAEARGYVLNVFVEPEYRRRGLARALIELCMAEARRRHIRVVSLHASNEGRPLYESMGFRSTNEMMFTGER